MAEEYKGFEIKIVEDTFPLNPREEWDNIGHIVAWHRRYDLCDESEKHFSIEEFKTFMRNTKGVFLPVYMYDHSGISLSCDCVYPYNDRWDAGQLGFIYVTNKELCKEYGVKRVTNVIRKKAVTLLRGEIQTFSAYVSGDVWGYQVIDPETDDSIAECYGFYGYDESKEYMINEAKQEVDAVLKIAEEEKWEHLQKKEECI